MFYIKYFTLGVNFRIVNTRTLHLAIRFIALIRLLLYLVAAVFVGVLLYSIINQDAFANVLIENGFKARLSIGDFKTCNSCIGSEHLTIGGLSGGMKFWLLIRGIILMGLTIMSLHVLSRIISTIKSKSTFYSSNINGFKRLFRIGLLLAFFSCFNFFIQGSTTDFEFSIPFGVLGYSLGCWLLAEIFREGKTLSDDNKSIV